MRAELAASVPVLAVMLSLNLGVSLSLRDAVPSLGSLPAQRDPQKQGGSAQSVGKTPTKQGQETQRHIVKGTIKSFSETVLLLASRVGSVTREMRFLRVSGTKIEGRLATKVRSTVYYHVINGNRVADRVVVWEQENDGPQSPDRTRGPTIGVASATSPGGAGVGRRRDPFESLTSRESSAAKTASTLPMGKAGLQVSTLRIDGLVRTPNGMIAVVTSPQQRTYFLREGDQLYDGRVEKIMMDGVSFHEMGKDAFGKPVERKRTKRLYPSSGDQQ